MTRFLASATKTTALPFTVRGNIGGQCFGAALNWCLSFLHVGSVWMPVFQNIIQTFCTVTTLEDRAKGKYFLVSWILKIMPPLIVNITKMYKGHVYLQSIVKYLSSLWYDGTNIWVPYDTMAQIQSVWHLPEPLCIAIQDLGTKGTNMKVNLMLLFSWDIMSFCSDSGILCCLSASMKLCQLTC